MAGPVELTHGPFAGWQCWESDPFETTIGQMAFRTGEDGEVECGLVLEPRHMNGHGNAHGGLLMTFADFCLFAIARDHMGEHGGVTVSCTSQFTGPAHVGEHLTGRGRVVRGGHKMIFVELEITAGGRSVLAVSGIIKKVGAAFKNLTAHG